jgi:hypothetical protein
MFDAPDMKEPLVKIELLPAQGNQFGHAQSMAIGQEDHHVIAFSVAADAARRFPQLLDLGWREMLSGTDVRMFVALGEGELRHAALLDAELSCLRCLVPEHSGSAA